MLPAVHDQVGSLARPLPYRYVGALDAGIIHRLDALAFDPSKSNRKLVNRFNRFVLHGDEKEDGGMDVDGTSSQCVSRTRSPGHFLNVG